MSFAFVSNEARWIQLPKSFFETISASNNYHCEHQNSHVIRIQKHRPIAIVCITAINPATLAMLLAFLSTTKARWHAAFWIVMDLLFIFFFQPVKFNARIFFNSRIAMTLLSCAITVTPWLVWVTGVALQCFTWKQTKYITLHLCLFVINEKSKQAMNMQHPV